MQASAVCIQYADGRDFFVVPTARYIPTYLQKKISTLCTYLGMYRELISSAIDYLTARHFEKKIHYMLNGDLGVGTTLRS